MRDQWLAILLGLAGIVIILRSVRGARAGKTYKLWADGSSGNVFGPRGGTRTHV